MRKLVLALVFIATCFSPTLGWANGDKGVVFPPSIVAGVVSVYDGDTLTVDTHPWPQVTIYTSVRVSAAIRRALRRKLSGIRRTATV